MKKNSTRIVLCVIVMIAAIAFAFQKNGKTKIYDGYVPAEGIVPDSATAVKIAEVILDYIYGKKQINSEKPLHAHLSKDSAVWNVYGTLPRKYSHGGVAEIQIQKSDCKVLNVTHGK